MLGRCKAMKRKMQGDERVVGVSDLLEVCAGDIEQALFEERWAGAVPDRYYSIALNEQLARIYEPK